MSREQAICTKCGIELQRYWYGWEASWFQACIVGKHAPTLGVVRDVV